ncbi:MAG TPA: HIT domain-containing protein [Candidatus Aenigmarchaeota archaeon]|nr:HIT domain-containing protein [Candidatus Aenigmarchaeota archaeon]
MKYIWSDRMDYLRNKGKRNQECIFCRARENAHILYIDRDIVLMLNSYPYNTGHLLLAPLKHYENLEDIPKDVYEKLFLLLKKAIALLKKSLNPLGFNVGINIGGEVAGASFKHIHIHIVPRFKRDSGFMEITANTKVMPQTLEDTYKELKKYIEVLKL